MFWFFKLRLFFIIEWLLRKFFEVVRLKSFFELFIFWLWEKWCSSFGFVMIMLFDGFMVDSVFVVGS